MQAQEWWTVAAAVTAVCSLLLCGVLARRMVGLTTEVRSLRDRPEARPADQPSRPAPGPRSEPSVAVVTSLPERIVVDVDVDADVDDAPPPAPTTGAVLLPTQEEVTRATLGRPMVRSAVVGHGVWRALRPESRDRIRGIVRREFRRRKRERLAAGRRAARTAPVDRVAAQAWLGSATPHARTTPPGDRP